tara:strand:- start:112 stop:300 length:189 start_codon:yes stop_codon:yes gene_type:complete
MKIDNKVAIDMLDAWKNQYDIDSHGEEYSEIHGKIMAILKKCNIHDLRTIFEALAEMGFKSD